MTDMTAEQANMRATAIRFNMTKEQREYVSGIESEYEEKIAKLYDEMNYLNNQLRQALSEQRVPEERDASHAPIEMEHIETIAWASGWNACRESMLAAAPAPAEPAQDELAKLLEGLEWLKVYERYEAVCSLLSWAGRMSGRLFPLVKPEAARLRGGSDE